MSIPPFNHHGVIRPFNGSQPDGDLGQLSPYQATPKDVINSLGFSSDRKELLKCWIDYRRELTKVGLGSGFQWLVGSFVEDGKSPKDIDLVTFHHKPNGSLSIEEIINRHPNLFRRDLAKEQFRVDPKFVSLDIPAEKLIRAAAFFLNLFSHQRETFKWKGVLQVPLGECYDAEGMVLLGGV